FLQIVEAVRHCHANGVVHRDIKDENVLLNLHTSEAKLIDFGCGTMLKVRIETAYTEFAGTPEFYPPEWFLERRYMGRKVDAWSLGVLLYTMVEAEVPFQKEKDIIACELRHKRAQTTTSEACRHLISLMLQKDQHARPSLSEILHHPWFTGPDQPVMRSSAGV
uniref:non-specific serine/threonine protein kinase n=1 Tax=Ciona savignyi TaxID=51511 RepID=H2ZGG8_CIOSA